jgi:hypothetical protein
VNCALAQVHQHLGLGHQTNMISNLRGKQKICYSDYHPVGKKQLVVLVIPLKAQRKLVELTNLNMHLTGSEWVSVKTAHHLGDAIVPFSHFYCHNSCRLCASHSTFQA